MITFALFKASECLKNCLKADPKNEEYLLAIGICYSMANEESKSIKYFNFCTVCYPDSAIAWILLLQAVLKNESLKHLVNKYFIIRFFYIWKRWRHIFKKEHY